jgi:hypothetical protein
MSRNDPYHILSLDGGGSWALLQVMALKAIFGDVPGRAVFAQFDLVAANSGGSIVLAALAEGLPLSEIESFFLSGDERRKIFVALPWWQKYLRLAALLRLAGVGPRYAAPAKLAGLRELLPKAGGVRLDQLAQAIARETGWPTHFLITGFDYEINRAVSFRSDTRSGAASFAPEPCPTLAEAVHASTDAPINYFDRPAAFAHTRFWDGAVAGYNNPVLAGVVEVLASRGPDAGIAVLSIGTGTVRLPMEDGTVRPPLAQPRERESLPGDLDKMATSILDDPPDAATFIAHVTLHQPLPTGPDQPVETGCVVRMSPVIRPVKEGGAWRLPNGLTEQEFAALADLSMDAVKDAQVELIRRLGIEWLADRVPNQPIRAGADYACEIGHATFGEARQAWERLRQTWQ